MTNKFPQFYSNMLMSFIFMTFTFKPLMGFCTSTGRVYNKSCTWTSTTGCLCLRRTGVFVPPQGNMPLRMSSVTPEDLEQEPRRMSFYDTGGLEYVPRRMSFYDTGGLKHMPRRGSHNNLWRLYGASTGGPGHGDKAPTGVDTCSLCKLAHGPAEAEWRVLQMGVCPPIYRVRGGHTGGGTLPGRGVRARASRTGASAEAARQRGTDRQGCTDWRGCSTGGGAHASGRTGGGAAPRPDRRGCGTPPNRRGCAPRRTGGGAAPARTGGGAHPAEPAGVCPRPNRWGCGPRQEPAGVRPRPNRRGCGPCQEPAGVPPPGPPINGVGLHSLAISSSSSGRELCGPPVPGSLVDGRAVHVHACIVRASPAIPRAFVPVFEGHVHFIVLDASGSCAALNEDLVTGFPLSEVRFVPSRRCFGCALHSELVTSVVPGSPRVYPVTRGLFNLRFVSGSTNAPHGISVGDVDDGGYPVALPKRAAFPLHSPSSVLLQRLSDVRTIRLAGLTMPRSTKHRGESSRASRRSEGDVQRTEDPMPHFTLSPLREDDPERLDKGVKVCALGPLEETSPSEGVVDMRRVDRTERGYRYRRGGDYPGHFPLDEHLFPFIQSFVPVNWEGPDGLLLSERAQLERAILVGRDSMMGTCSFHYPSFPVDYTAQAHFPEAGQLGLFSAEPVNRVRELMLAQGLWEVHGLPKTGPTFTGHIPLPSGPEFVSEGYDRSCFLDRIMSKEAAGWYDRWSVISSHRFRFGATEWLMGILYHYRQLLDQVGLLHAVVAALYSYPCHSGLLQALAERFNRRFNTFCVADGETCLDLWALHRISGLPISGQFYEEVCLNDLLRDQSTDAGSYVLSHSFRYLMKVWRDLARCGRDECPSASKGTVRVSCDAWLRFFYNGPFCFHKEFASESYDPADYLQLSVTLENNAKYLYAPQGRGWNPRQLSDRTYLAAYLVYWLSTFVVPFGEEGNIRPEVIYPACSLASGVQLALAPAALANIFHGLGELTASPSPRDRSIVLPTHHLSAWAGLLLPELCHNVSLENPSMPLLFMFRNCPEQAHRRQLEEARRRLSFVPSVGQLGLDHACCSRDFRPYAEESGGENLPPPS
ncbi:hypothetical protein Taro_008513 [Colocasia esculenta]|uniref:Aminotransferase-like plant mobile domain-containing protein n=1 Tax=Colocasia esculenta TaxID=4460 RepID=A0A843TYG7_COLES|nr:hypothetical protein [Colocasia esculenta]